MSDFPMIVKVKPLVWVEAYDSHPWGWKARCAIMGGFYYADNDAEKREQDDLRAARILAALDLTPDPRVTALVEAAAGYRRAINAFDGTGSISDKLARVQSWQSALDAALAAFKGGADDRQTP